MTVEMTKGSILISNQISGKIKKEKLGRKSFNQPGFATRVVLTILVKTADNISQKTLWQHFKQKELCFFPHIKIVVRYQYQASMTIGQYWSECHSFDIKNIKGQRFIYIKQ